MVEQECLVAVEDNQCRVVEDEQKRFLLFPVVKEVVHRQVFVELHILALAVAVLKKVEKVIEISHEEVPVVQ